MQFRPSVKAIFLSYSDSFDHFIVAKKGCSPAGVLPMLSVACVVLLVPSIRSALGIGAVTVPFSCVILASALSLVTWKAYPNRTLVSILQFFDITLYSSALISISSLSTTLAAASLFSSLWIISTVYWATAYGFSAMGFISVVLGPVIVVLSIGGTVFPDVSIALGAMLWIFVSRLTKAKRQHLKRTIGVLSILDNAADNAADLRQSSITDRHNLKLIGILHKAKNDLTPAKWNIEYLSKQCAFSEEHQQVLNETKECIDSTLDELYLRLENYRARTIETPFYYLCDLISEIQEHLSLFPHLDFRADNSSDPMIEGRIDDIRLSIMTLMENSKDAGATRCVLKYEPLKNSNHCRLQLRDNGPGLPSKVKEHLFEPFNSYGKRDGVGLGLYLSSRLVSANSGSLTLVESDKNGTVFQFELSLHTPMHNSAATKSAELF